MLCCAEVAAQHRLLSSSLRLQWRSPDFAVHGLKASEATNTIAKPAPLVVRLIIADPMTQQNVEVNGFVFEPCAIVCNFPQPAGMFLDFDPKRRSMQRLCYDQHTICRWWMTVVRTPTQPSRAGGSQCRHTPKRRGGDCSPSCLK